VKDVPRTSRRWLIIQLARFGDLLQTAPLTAAAPEDVEIDLLVDASLEKTARLLPNVERVLPFERSAALKYAVSGEVGRWNAMVGALAGELRGRKYARVINLTHTAESACIARLCGCGDVRGANYDRRGLFTDGPWERVFRATLKRRDWAGLHLVDLHLLSAGIEPQPGKFSARRSGGLRIGLQLGANSTLRRWPVQAFVDVAEAVSRAMPVEFVLLGSAGETSLSGEFAKLFQRPVEDLTGRTTPTELFAVVEACDLLISGDTGTIHMAALAGTQTVGLFLAMARPDDTAPYQRGAVIFEPRTTCYPCPENHSCSHTACHADIDVALVAETAISLLKNVSVSPTDGARYRLRIVDFDPMGLLTLSGQTETTSDLRRKLVKQLWLSEHHGVQPIRSCVKLYREDAGQLECLTRLASQGATLAEEFKLALMDGRPDRGKLQKLQESVVAVENLSADSGIAGLLAQLFSIELERPPVAPLDAVVAVDGALSMVQRRCRYLLAKTSVASERGAA